jgi:glycyl-tRNA synthetase
VIEPAAGADRATLAFLVDSYDVEEVEGRQRTVLRLHPRSPRSRSPSCRSSPRRACRRRRARSSRAAPPRPAEFDEGGSIGKRYRRQDEIGTPWGITVDHQTMEDDTVTLRDRDSLEQSRVPIDGLADDLANRLVQPWQSPKLD